MKRISAQAAVAFMLAVLCVRSTPADDPAEGSVPAKHVCDDTSDCDMCRGLACDDVGCDKHVTGTACDCDACCDPGCEFGEPCPGVFVQAESLFFKYYRADGVRSGSYNNVPASVTDEVKFDYNISPRLTLGYVFDGGLGFRARWWEYDQYGDPVFPDTGVAMGVNTQLVDMELFEVFKLNDRWAVEFAGGVRYNEFEEVLSDPIPSAIRTSSFDGFGGLLSLEARRSLGRWGALYVRGRGAIMQGDKEVFNTLGSDPEQNAVLRDSTLGATELALGYEYRRPFRFACMTLRTGYEWQNWYNYSCHFTPVTTAPLNSGAEYAGPADVGFGGFTLSLAFER
jgi:hypothetical protein